ncbi:MAG: hypothetical protein V4496_01925 [Pseudomonadota bacterium]
MKQALTLLILVELSILVSSAPAWADNPNPNFNPFTPPENIQLFYQVIYPDPSETVIEYKMYMQTGGKMIALLNETFVSEGDTFQGMQVKSVNSKRVVLLTTNGEKRIVVIDAEQSKLQKLREMMNEESQ